MSYFSQFPTISYANVTVTDVTRRVTMPSSVLRQPTAFSPYTVEGLQKEDTIAYLYYDQDDDDWLISLANQIVDPYFGWFMDDDELNGHMVQKYGSLPEAMGRVSFWRTNWASDQRTVPIGYYDALTENLKRYWIPVFGQGSDVLGYQRRQEDWFCATNRFLDFTANGAPWLPGELVSVSVLSGGAQVGTGEIVENDGVSVRVKDVTGDWSTGNFVAGVSGTTQVQSQLDPVLFIPVDEVPYWESVSCYDEEYDRNEANKEILLIQKQYRGTMYAELARALTSPVVA